MVYAYLWHQYKTHAKKCKSKNLCTYIKRSFCSAIQWLRQITIWALKDEYVPEWDSTMVTCYHDFRTLRWLRGLPCPAASKCPSCDNDSLPYLNTASFHHVLMMRCKHCCGSTFYSHMPFYNANSLSLSSRAFIDQHTWPQVHARFHGLETPPRVLWPSFQSASRCSPCSLVEDGRVLLFHILAGIAHRYWHVGSVYFEACVRGNAVVDHVLYVWGHSWKLIWGPWYYVSCLIV